MMASLGGVYGCAHWAGFGLEMPGFGLEMPIGEMRLGGRGEEEEGSKPIFGHSCSWEDGEACGWCISAGWLVLFPCRFWAEGWTAAGCNQRPLPLFTGKVLVLVGVAVPCDSVA